METTVTRDHRRVAAELLGDSYAHASLVREWVASGDDMPNGDAFDGGGWVDEDDAEIYYAMARAIAAAETRGAATNALLSRVLASEFLPWLLIELDAMRQDEEPALRPLLSDLIALLDTKPAAPATHPDTKASP